MTYQISKMETEARTLLDGYLAPLAKASQEGGSWAEWHDARLVQMVFVPMHCAALPVDRIHDIAKALAGYSVEAAVDLQPTLTKMVKAKVLRSRMLRGNRLYEINFSF